MFQSCFSLSNLKNSTEENLVIFFVDSKHLEGKREVLSSKYLTYSRPIANGILMSLVCPKRDA